MFLPVFLLVAVLVPLVGPFARILQVNLHKSGLKISPKVVPDQIAKESVEEVPAQVAAVVEAAAEEKPKEASGGDAPAPPADAPPEEGKKKKKGWRKYILFGPRSGGDQGSS